MINFRTLKGENICKTRKKLNNIGAKDVSVNPAFVRTKVVKEAVKKFKYVPQEIKTVPDVLNFINDELIKQPYVNKESVRCQIAESQAISKRYLEADARTCIKPQSKSLRFAGSKIDVLPDFVYEYEGYDPTYKGNFLTVEVVLLSAGRTEMGNALRNSKDTDVFHSLISLSLLLYGIDVLGNRKGIVKVTFDSLKSSEDKNGDFSNPWMVARPFSSTKKDHSVSYSILFKNKKFVDYSDGIYNKALESTKKIQKNLFKDFKEYFLTFEKGEENCSKTLCDECSYKDICTYVHPPVTENTAIAKKEINDFTLSPEQEKIVNFDKGICRVNAGAGVGKTFVIVQHIIKLLEKGVDPNDILVTTFTNSGIEELKARIKKFIEIYEFDVDPREITVCSFNSLGSKLIEKNYNELGFTRIPYLIDDIEAYDLIVSMIKEKKPIDGLDYRNLFMNFGNNLVGAVPFLFKEFTLIREKNCSDVYEYMDASESVSDIHMATEIFSLYKEYDNLMKCNNFIDYSDQSNLVIELLKINDTAVVDAFNYSHIIVDEFQDTNDFQLIFISELISSMKFKSLMVVGDDSQSIFKFRGTSVENIINFEEKIGSSIYDFTLGQSYRSTGSIIDAANKVIALNTNRIDKTMVSAREQGKKPRFRIFEKSNAELSYIADEIEKLASSGVSLKDIAFISFKNSTLNSLNKLLAKKGILGLSGKVSFLDDSRIKAAIALAEYLYDNENTKGLLVYLNDLFNDSILTMNEGKAKELLRVNLEDYERLIGIASEDKKKLLINLLKALDDGTDSVYTSFLGRILSKENYSFAELIDYILKFKLYNSRASVTRAEKYEAVTLTTAHSSKGLEWKHVFLSLSDFDNKVNIDLDDREETRRLIFVGITRAKDNLTVSSVRGYETKSGAYHNNRFCSELSTLTTCFEVVGREE